MIQSDYACSVVPRAFLETPSYDLWMEFLKALDEGREKIASQDAKLRTSPQFLPPTTESVQQSQILVNELIKDVLKFATSQWMQGPVGYTAYSSIPKATPPKKADITRVIAIVNHCIHYGLPSLCRDLFKDMTKAQQEPWPFILNYQPLVKPLCDFLRQKNVDIASTPFIKFFKTIIATYICLVLGKEDQPHNVNLRRVGCASAACPDCRDLDTFMLDASRPTHTFRMVQKRRIHLEERARAASDLCTVETIRSGMPHGTKITKHSDIMSSATWEVRQRNAQTFLASFGTEDVLRRIMGDHFRQVQDALAGTTPLLVSTVVQKMATAQARSGNLVSPNTIATTRGTKRKERDF